MKNNHPTEPSIIPEYDSIIENPIELPETIIVPMNHLIKLAIDNNLESSSIDLEKNKIIFQKYNSSWFIIFRNSYFAVPEELMKTYDNKKNHNSYLEYLTHETARYKFRYKNKRVLIYSTNIPLTNIVSADTVKRIRGILALGQSDFAKVIDDATKK